MRCLSLKLLGGGALSGNICYQKWQWEHLAPVPNISFAPVPGIPFCCRQLSSAGLPKKEDVFNIKASHVIRQEIYFLAQSRSHLLMTKDS